MKSEIKKLLGWICVSVIIGVLGFHVRKIITLSRIDGFQNNSGRWTEVRKELSNELKEIIAEYLVNPDTSAYETLGSGVKEYYKKFYDNAVRENKMAMNPIRWDNKTLDKMGIDRDNLDAESIKTKIDLYIQRATLKEVENHHLFNERHMTAHQFRKYNRKQNKKNKH